MKSEIVLNGTQVKTRAYPWLGHIYIGDEQWEKVVLFTSRNVGIVVSAIGSCIRLGEYCESWDEDAFEEFKGKVILSND